MTLRIILSLIFTYQLLITASADSNRRLAQGYLLCAGTCICDYDESTIDCSNQGLTEIPSFRFIAFQAFVVKFDNNSIKSLKKNDFTDSTLSNLKELYLDENGLDSIEDGTFEPLDKLQLLSLVNNKLEDFPHSSLNELRNSLRTLDLGYNMLTFARFNVSMDSLTKLMLNFNGITQLDEDSFSGLYKLNSLNLDYNPLRTLNLDGSSLNGLSSIKELTFEYNLFGEVPEASAFQAVRETLDYLSFSRNSRLEAIQPQNFTNLRHLDLSMCNIKTIANETFIGTPQLEILDLAYSQVAFIARSAFSNLGNLSCLNLTSSSFRFLPYDALLEVSESLKELVINDLPLSTIHNMTDPDMYGVLLSSLENLELSRNQLSQIKVNSFFVNLVNLKKLSMSYTLLETIPREALQNLQSLQTLEFNGNPIEYIEDSSFPMMNSLSNLVIQSSQYLESVEDWSFSQLASLETLLLNSNPSLERLSNQSLVGIEKLKNLDISYNALEKAETAWFDNKSLVKLVLDGNKWKCDCEMIEFQKFIISSVDIIESDPTCYYPRILRRQEIEKVDNLICGRLCPDSCLCYDRNVRLFDPSSTSMEGEVVTANCMSEFLQELPTNLPDTLENLRLGENLFPKFNFDEQLSGLKQLQSISLTVNKISLIEPFRNATKLKRLDLSANFIGGLVSDAFLFLKELQDLMLDRNSLINLDKNLFSGLEQLQSLYLSNNRIVHLSSTLIQENKKLRLLEAYSNPLRQLQANFLISESLELLNLESCQIAEVSSDAFVQLTNLKTLFLSGNNIKSISQDWSLPGSLHSLDISTNQLEQLPSTSSFGSNFSSLILSDNLIANLSSCQLNETETSLQLNILDLSGNPIKTVASSVACLQPYYQTRFLLMSNCELEVFPTEIFEEMVFLEHLVLDGNPVSSIGGVDDVISGGNQLKRLSLRSMAHLEAIENSSFKLFPNLEELEISNSAVLNFIGAQAFQGMPSLKVLDLSRNSLSIPLEDWFLSLNLTHVDLYRNPWICDCQSLPYMEWLNEVASTSETSFSYSVVCSSPESLKGVDLSSLSPADVCFTVDSTTAATTRTTRTTRATRTTTVAATTTTTQDNSGNSGTSSSPNSFLLLVLTSFLGLNLAFL